MKSTKQYNMMDTAKPPWIRVKVPSGNEVARIRDLKKSKLLHTVCEEALCPNLAECWEKGSATFLILGSICTRNCRFCNIRSGKPEKVDREEPLRVADAISAMKLRHAVITSVDRDDLIDGGASVFVETIKQIRTRRPECSIEVLIPDFKGRRSSLESLIEARPDILNHNLETVRRLYPEVRPQAAYQLSLDILRMAKEMNPNGLTKSGIMVGLGETWKELEETLYNLHDVGCDILTIGQYLRPSPSHLPVSRYYTPEEFESMRRFGYNTGFLWVESGPLVRSSYRAEVQARKLQITRREQG